GNPQQALKDKGVIDSGCSRHMTGNMSYLSDLEELNGGYVSFGGNPKGGKSASTPIDVDKPLLKDSDGCYLRNMVMEIVVFNILSDNLPITTNGIQLTMVFNLPMLHLLRVEMVINSPWMLSKNWLVQKQTAFGKDISNSFMADNLPKIVWFSTHQVTFMKSWLVQKQTALDAAEGFKQIINFLSGSYIHYALTLNPHIYISCIKQFWNTTSVKRSNDVTRLQALVDRKKIVISEDVIREILQLDDAEGVSLSAKRTSWNEFSTAMASANQVGDLSTHTTRYISPALTQKVFANIRRVRKGFSGVEAPLFEGMLAARQLAEEGITDEQGAEFPTHIQQVLDVCSALTIRVENLEHDKAAQKLEIIKLKVRVKRLERANKVKSSKLRHLRKVGASSRIESFDDIEDVFNLGRMIDDLDKDEGIKLVKDADIAETEGRHAAKQVEKQAEIYNLDLDHPSKVLSMQEDDSELQEVVEVVTTAKLTTDDKHKGILVETPKPMKKKDQIELDAEYERKLHEEINKDHEDINKDIDWDATIHHNTAGYKMDFFKGMSYAEICPIFQARATPLVRKVLVADYQIILIDNKPRFKIIRADETHQLYISFITLLKNFDSEDLENLWGIVKDRFSTSKPTNFSDEYLLLTLKTMFEKPDGQDAIWKNQRSVHGLALVKSWKLLTSCGVYVITLSTIQLILLVERRYPLSRFTLEKLVNVTRLQVEEESEMSLELLRFTRQQLQKYQQG
nr:hypothetical protein [Tanacetum cinerariifolium]